MTRITDSERAELKAWRSSDFEEVPTATFMEIALLGLEVGLRRQSVDLQRLSQLISSIHSSAHEADRLLHPEHHGERP